LTFNSFIVMQCVNQYVQPFSTISAIEQLNIPEMTSVFNVSSAASYLHQQ